LIEGAAVGALAVGGDNDPEAVAAARTNARAAGIRVDIEQWDARALPLKDQSVDRIVTNLPWGRQIPVDEELSNFYRSVCAEMMRVLAPGGRIALLTSTPDLLQWDGLKPDSMMEISLFGQTPTIAVYTTIR
jgi:23S rRNA G2445 N2-methylase RlmL